MIRSQIQAATTIHVVLTILFFTIILSSYLLVLFLFFFNDTATTEIYTLSLHDALPICSKHITLNATGGGFLTASKQFRHGATSKSRSNTASNSTKHKSPHLSGWRQIISLIT